MHLNCTILLNLFAIIWLVKVKNCEKLKALKRSKNVYVGQKRKKNYYMVGYRLRNKVFHPFLFLDLSGQSKQWTRVWHTGLMLLEKKVSEKKSKIYIFRLKLNYCVHSCHRITEDLQPSRVLFPLRPSILATEIYCYDNTIVNFTLDVQSVDRPYFKR